MGNKLVDILLGRGEGPVKSKTVDVDQIKKDLESSHSSFDAALVQGSRSRREKNASLKRATEVIRLVPSLEPTE